MEILVIINVLELLLLIVVLIACGPYLFNLTKLWEALLAHAGSVIDHARRVIELMARRPPPKKARPIVRKRAMRAYPRRKIQPRRRR